MALDDVRATAVRWRPMLFGAILRDQGFTTSPFNIQPAKSRHMWRDVERRAADLGIRINRPDPFPQGSLRAARAMLVGLEGGWGPAFAMSVFAAEFEDGRDIADFDVIADCVRNAGGEADRALDLAGSDAIKLRLKEQTAVAGAAGVLCANLCRRRRIVLGRRPVRRGAGLGVQRASLSVRRARDRLSDQG